MGEEVCGLAQHFKKLNESQDMIGLLRLLEGMMPKDIVKLQQTCIAVSGSRVSIERWVYGLITYILEIIHMQWRVCILQYL